MKRFFLPVLGLLALAPSAEAAQCNCRSQSSMGTNQSYSYQSGPPGICSVAEDVKMCSANQIQVGKNWSPDTVLKPRHAGRDPNLATVFREAGVKMPAGDALMVAGLTPPEEYGDRLADVLTAILGLSLRAQPERLAELHAALRSNADAVAKPFSDPKGLGTIRLDEYEAVVSYGCLEVSQGTFFARARTPFALSETACQGTRT